MKRCMKTKINLEDLNPPRIVNYSWFMRPWDRKSQEYWLRRVAEWVQDLNAKYNLGIEVIQRDNTVKVVLPENGEEVARFGLKASRKNFYVRRSFRKLLKLIREKVS